jgi:hypothetical protein
LATMGFVQFSWARSDIELSWENLIVLTSILALPRGPRGQQRRDGWYL